MTKILSVCVNYNDEENTIRFVSDFLRQLESEFLQIIIADTSDRKISHPSLIQLQNKDPRVSVFTLGRNLGYFGAAHYTLSRYLEKNDLPDWIIISNTDLFFSGDDLILKLLSCYPQNRLDIIAPSIISTKTYLDQNPYLHIKPLRLKLVFQNILLKYFYAYRVYQYLYDLKQFIKSRSRKQNFFKDCRIKEMKYIYAPHGSFIILPNEYFIRGMTLNYQPFLYGEEYFIAESAESISLRICYEPNLLLFHDEHRSTGRSLNKSKWRYLAQANSFCLNNYFNKNKPTY